MRQYWRSGWLAVAAAVGVWRCAIDDRSVDQLGAPNQPGDAGLPGAMTRDTGQPGGGAGASTGAAGAAGAGMGAAGAGTGAAGADPGAAGNGGATGGTPGAAGAGTAGSSAGADGSMPTGASGSGGSGGIDPFDNIPATASTCPAFTACGGELEGAWSYSDICADTSSVSILQQALSCPTISLRIEPGGPTTLTFSSDQVTRQGTLLGDSVLTVPNECDLAVPCSDLSAAGGTCNDVNGPCICRRPENVDWGTQPYAVSGGQLSLQDGRTFDYCVQGARLTYRETGDAQEAGTFTLQRN